MTARQLLNFIDSLKETVEIDFLVDELSLQRGDLAVDLECCSCRKTRKLYNDLCEKIDAIEMMKHQRLLFYKLTMRERK